MMALDPPHSRLVAIQTLGVEALDSSHFVYVFQCSWADRPVTLVKHEYDVLFKVHCALLDQFPDAAGTNGGKRTIPLFPGTYTACTSHQMNFTNHVTRPNPVQLTYHFGLGQPRKEAVWRQHTIHGGASSWGSRAVGGPAHHASR